MSPNVSYPQLMREAATRTLADESRRRDEILVRRGSPDPVLAQQAEFEAVALDRAVEKARDDLARLGDRQRSFVGLERPLLELRNPGIVSIPLGSLRCCSARCCDATGVPDRSGRSCTHASTRGSGVSGAN